MEIMDGEDINGEIDESYGYLNGTLPDAELYRFVDGLASRIALFDRQDIFDTEKPVNVASLARDAEMQTSWDVLWPHFSARQRRHGSRDGSIRGSVGRAMWSDAWAATRPTLARN